MPKASKKPSTRRSRSFGGCGTCRKRHVKCDQVRPVCLTCKAVGADCEGFSAEIRWMSSKEPGAEPQVDDSPALGGSATRRHLYSESDRERMSRSMTSSFKIGSVDASLSKLDSRSKENSSGKDDISVGPFGVLNFNQPAPPVQAEEQLVPMDIVPEQAPMPEVEHASIPSANAQNTPFTMDSFIGLDDSLQWADLFGFGSNGMPLDNNLFDSFLDIDGSTAAFPVADEIMLSDGSSDVISHGYNALAGSGSKLTTTDPVPITKQDVLVEAQMLLKHFNDKVVPRWASLPITSKSTWESIMLPEAINTLAHLTFLQTASLTAAKTASFYGVLGISAQHIAGNPAFEAQYRRPPGYWRAFTSWVTTEAKKSLQQSLMNELHGIGKAKYKDQMGAILGLFAVATISGQPKEARCYMIDCERLMRTRGLAKRGISRKCRLMHHTYTWCRIIGESTYVLHEHRQTTAQLAVQIVSPDVETRPAQHANGPGSRLDDFLRLELHQEENSDLDIGEFKAPEVSIQDIHLEDSRINPDTLYGEIYGVNETWLSLLAQTTRLANKMDAVKACNTCDASIHAALQRRAARLEDMICSFAADFTPRLTAPKYAPNNHMHRALNSALVIFFYRRIREVNAWILQSHVENVISALRAFDESLIEKSWEGPGTPWPAFMAGCEAATQANRDILRTWLEKAAATTCFQTYRHATELLAEVWRKRDDTGHGEAGKGGSSRATRRGGRAAQPSASWVDVCREKKTWLMAF